MDPAVCQKWAPLCEEEGVTEGDRQHLPPPPCVDYKDLVVEAYRPSPTCLICMAFRNELRRTTQAWDELKRDHQLCVRQNIALSKERINVLDEMRKREEQYNESFNILEMQMHMSMVIRDDVESKLAEAEAKLEKQAKWVAHLEHRLRLHEPFLCYDEWEANAKKDQDFVDRFCVELTDEK